MQYASIKYTLSETESFLNCLRIKFPVLQTFNDSMWWNGLSKLTINEAIHEIQKTKIDLKNVDIEWEALIAKQSYNYHNICAAYKIVSPSIDIHLFKAKSHQKLDNIISQKHIDNLNKLQMSPKLGWENYDFSTNFIVVPIDGDHSTMTSDPENRSLLGKELANYIKLHK